MFRHFAFLVIVVVVGASSVAPAPAYRFHAVPWPGGVVRYYNAAPDQAWAVSHAVSAWNHSGAHVRFVAVPRAAADLVIHEESDKVYCAEGHASVGDVRGAHVVIFPAHGITHACNRYWAVRVMAHELGHVLGLAHEDRYCALMNAYATMRGGSACPLVIWAWRCRLLESDDVAGVVSIYGGTARAPAPDPYCPLYAAMHAPTRPSVDQEGSTITLAFVRPRSPSIPSFAIPSPWHREEGFTVSAASPTCREAGRAAPTSPWYFWHAPVGGVQHISIPAAQSAGCFAVWALDRLGRPSAHPAFFSFG